MRENTNPEQLIVARFFVLLPPFLHVQGKSYSQTVRKRKRKVFELISASSVAQKKEKRKEKPSKERAQEQAGKAEDFA